MTTLLKMTEWHWAGPGKVETCTVELWINEMFRSGQWKEIDRYAYAIDRVMFYF